MEIEIVLGIIGVISLMVLIGRGSVEWYLNDHYLEEMKKDARKEEVLFQLLNDKRNEAIRDIDDALEEALKKIKEEKDLKLKKMS